LNPPLHPCPGLQGDAGHPSCPLFDGPVESSRKELPSGHWHATLEADRREDLAAAHQMQPEAVLVILGQAGGLEHPVRFRLSQQFQGVPCVARADAGGRDESAESLPGHQILGVAFGEVVTIETVSEVQHRCRQRQNRCLNHVVVPGVVVYPQ